jgi:hypothetical protein
MSLCGHVTFLTSNPDRITKKNKLLPTMRCARANQLFALAALGLAHAGSASASLVNGLFRGASSGVDGFVEPHRGDASTSRQLQNYYFSTTELGAVNPNAAMGNPLRGLYTSPRWTNFNTPDVVPDSIDFYYIGLDEVMKSNTVFNWTALDDSIAAAVARNKHVAWRIICHYPGEPLRVPKYLVDAGIALVPTAADGISPQYDDPRLLEAFRLFIAAFGGRYDGNKAVAFIQLGLLGKWGEWHTFPENNLISTATRNQVIAWYSAAFTRTSLMARGPMDTAIAQGHGLHDDSFGYSTIGVVDYFFWPSVSRGGHTNFWRKGMMSGETRPELQGSIFEVSP